MEKKELKRTLDEHMKYQAKISELGGEHGRFTFLNQWADRE